MKTRRPAVALVALASITGAASAEMFFGDVIGSAELSGATFSGNLIYEHIGAAVGELTITLTNDTPIGVGGRLTAIAFRFDTADPFASTLLLSSSVSAMTNIGSANASPFGTFMGGAGTGGSFEGGGPPSTGIAIGASATFVWRINASDAGSLDEFSFLNATNAPGIAARFRGLTGGGSDKVPGYAIPAPAPVALIGLAGLVASRRRR